MDIDTMKKQAMEASGEIVQAGSMWYCNGCGAEADAVEDIAHKANCKLMKAVEGALGMLAVGGSLGCDQVPDNTMLDLVATLPRVEIAMIDKLVDDLLFARSDDARADIVHSMQQACPGIDSEMISGLALEGISTNAQRDALRACLLFERSLSSKQAELAIELDELLKDLAKFSSRLNQAQTEAIKTKLRNL